MQDEVSGEEESTLESNDLPGDEAEVNEAEKLNEEIVAGLLADDELSGTEELEEQVSKANDQVLRVQAEIQNIRRRAERDVENAHKYALEKFTADLLPVVDNLERAISTIDASDEGQKERCRIVRCWRFGLITAPSKPSKRDRRRCYIGL